MKKKFGLWMGALALAAISMVGCGGVDNSTSKPDVNLGDAKAVDQNVKEDATKNMKGKSFTTSDGEMGGATTRDMGKQ